MTAPDVIEDGRPLVVSATRGEIQHVTTDLPIIVTGVGCLATAITLTEALVRARLQGRCPSVLINIGTAGALRPDVRGTFEVSHAFKHDVNDDVITAIDGNPMLNDLGFETSGTLPTAVLATGDSFIADSVTKDRLAKAAHLVEMEGYAVALVGYRFGIPVTLIKQTSDTADEQAVDTWGGAVPEASKQLAQALHLLETNHWSPAVPTPVQRIPR